MIVQPLFKGRSMIVQGLVNRLDPETQSLIHVTTLPGLIESPVVVGSAQASVDQPLAKSREATGIGECRLPSLFCDDKFGRIEESVRE